MDGTVDVPTQLFLQRAEDLAEMVELPWIHVRLALLRLVGLELSVKFSSHGRAFPHKKVALIAENNGARKQLPIPRSARFPRWAAFPGRRRQIDPCARKQL